MGLLLIALVLLAVVCAVILMALLHAGFFSDIRIRTSTPLSAPRRVAYGVHTGPYSNAGGPFRQIQAVAPERKLFGIYYDDPGRVAKEKLRYGVGCCLSDSASPSLEGRLKGRGYSIWTFPACSRAVITEFPRRSMLSLLIAPRCVYPALSKYFKKYKLDVGPILEVYEDDCIRYIAPLDNRDGFFVPEVAMESEKKKEQ